jgi:phosphoketolase
MRSSSYSLFASVTAAKFTNASKVLICGQADAAEQWYSEAIQRHKLYVAENGDDLPEIRDWRWAA